MAIVYSSLNHPERVPLAAEVHSRPFLWLDAPESLTHLAVYAREKTSMHSDSSVGPHAALSAFCVHFGVTPPVANAKYFFHDFGRFRLKWECHTEFATYTFAERHQESLPIESAFERMPLCHLPQEWLRSLQGTVMVAAHVVLDKTAASVDVLSPAMRSIFEGTMLVGSHVLQGAAICTDFLIQADGFSRFVACDVGLQDQQSSQLVQRLLEIETYRMMALLGLPHAQRATPLLNAIEDELAALTVTMVNMDEVKGGKGELHNADEEQALLHTITGLAARMERLSLDNSYRFSASQAYFRLVQARIAELREIRVDGIPTVGEFMDRRLAPAMNTCAAIARRQEALAERIANTNDLLRSRVGIVQEQQNRKILESMNTRAAQQLRLQQAVEGLSVVAISYYLVGLFSYASKAAKAVGLPINPDIAAGALIPFLVIGIWIELRKLHKKIRVA